MNTKAQITLGGLLLAILIVASGCTTAEKPNYQGHKGTAPTVNDYYPTKPKQ